MAGPYQRRLTTGISAGADALSQILGMILQNRMLEGRQQKTQDATFGRELLNDFATSSTKLLDPKEVAANGPEAQAAQYRLLKRRLPASLQKFTGEDPDFSKLDSTPQERMAALTGDLSKVTNPDDPMLSSQGLRKLAPGRRVATDVTQTGFLPNESDDPTVLPSKSYQSKTTEDPAFTELTKLAEQMKSGLLAKESRTPVKKIGANGAETTSYPTAREMGSLGEVQSERTPEQEAGRQGAIRTATAQADQDVINDPRNVKGFLDKAEAEAYRTRIASLTADRKMGAGSYAPQWHVIEDQDDAGNKVYKVIDQQQGGSYGTNVSSEPQTDAMRTAYAYATRGVTAHNMMSQLEPVLMKKGYLETRAGLSLDEINAPEAISDPVIRQYAQATRTFINAALGRPESGGAIQKDEYDRYAKMAAFTPGIDATTMKQVQQSRREALAGLTVKAGSRMGGQFTTPEELAAADRAAGRNTPVDQLIKQAEQDGYKVMR